MKMGDINKEHVANLLSQCVRMVTCSFCKSYFTAVIRCRCGCARCAACWSGSCVACGEQMMPARDKTAALLTERVRALVDAFQNCFEYNMEEIVSSVCTNTGSNVVRWLNHSKNHFSMEIFESNQSDWDKIEVVMPADNKPLGTHNRKRTNQSEVTKQWGSVKKMRKEFSKLSKTNKNKLNVSHSDKCDDVMSNKENDTSGHNERQQIDVIADVNHQPSAATNKVPFIMKGRMQPLAMRQSTCGTHDDMQITIRMGDTKTDIVINRKRQVHITTTTAHEQQHNTPSADTNTAHETPLLSNDAHEKVNPGPLETTLVNNCVQKTSLDNNVTMKTPSVGDVTQEISLICDGEQEMSLASISSQKPPLVSMQETSMVGDVAQEISLVSNNTQEISLVSNNPQEISLVSNNPQEISSVSNNGQEISLTNNKPEEISFVSNNAQEISLVSNIGQETSFTSTGAQEAQLSKDDEQLCQKMDSEKVEYDDLMPQVFAEIDADMKKHSENIFTGTEQLTLAAVEDADSDEVVEGTPVKLVRSASHVNAAPQFTQDDIKHHSTPVPKQLSFANRLSTIDRDHIAAVLEEDHSPTVETQAEAPPCGNGASLDLDRDYMAAVLAEADAQDGAPVKEPPTAPSPCVVDERTSPLLHGTIAANTVAPICVAGSCLKPHDMKLLKKECNRRNWTFYGSYAPEVSHLIVGVDEENKAQRSVKYMLALAAGKWILSSRWLHAAAEMPLHSTMPDESQFEVLDWSGTEAPRLSRISPRSLFTGLTFYCMPPFNVLDTDTLHSMIVSSGGVVLSDMSMMKAHAPVLLLSEPADTATDKYSYVCWQHGAVPVNVEWLLNCIGSQALLSMAQCVLCPRALLANVTDERVRTLLHE